MPGYQGLELKAWNLTHVPSSLQVKPEPQSPRVRGAKGAPVKKEAAPVKKEAAPVKKEAAKKGASVKEEAVAVKKERKVFQLPGQTRETPLQVRTGSGLMTIEL